MGLYNISTIKIINKSLARTNHTVGMLKNYEDGRTLQMWKRKNKEWQLRYLYLKMIKIRLETRCSMKLILISGPQWKQLQHSGGLGFSGLATLNILLNKNK